MMLKVLMFEHVAWIQVTRFRVNGGLLWTRSWTSGFHKNKEFPDYRSNHQIFKELVTLIDSTVYRTDWNGY